MRLSFVLVLALLLIVPLVQGGASIAPTFMLRTTPATGVELNLGIAPNGHIFVGGWNAMVKSSDDGASWAMISNGLPLTVAADRTLRVDHATGRVFLDDTYLGCTLLQWTADEGASWTRAPVACGASVTDHEKITVGPRSSHVLQATAAGLYPSAVYVCANGLVDDACGASLDGGTTWLPLPPHAVECAYQGQPTVSSTGVIVEATNACGASVRTSADGGLTWSSHVVPVALDQGSGNVPVVATTPDGTIYFVFATPGFAPEFTFSKDGGVSWATPIALAPAGVTSTILPAVIGGSGGRIAVAYYGATGYRGNPGSAGATVAWDAYVDIVTAADSATPSVQPIKVNAVPLAHGCLSKQGGCGGDPIADYIDIDVGPDGRVYAVFMDASHGAAVGVVAVQTGGTNMRV